MSITDLIEPQAQEEIKDQAALPQEADSTQPYLQVGERVFKTREDVEKHIESAQSHISKLTSDWENAVDLVAKQEEALEKAAKMNDLIDAYSKKTTSGEAATQGQPDKEEIISEALRAFEQQRQQEQALALAQANEKTVADALRTHYGEKAGDIVLSVASENGMSPEDAISMAQRHPKAFLKMFDLSKKSEVLPSKGGVNTAAMDYTPSQGPRKSIMKMSVKDRAEYIRQRLLSDN